MYSNYIIGHAGDWAQLGNSRAWPFESSVSRAQGWDALPAPFRGQFLLLAPPGEQSVTVALPREAGVRAAPAASSVRPSLVSPGFCCHCGGKILPCTVCKSENAARKVGRTCLLKTKTKTPPEEKRGKGLPVLSSYLPVPGWIDIGRGRP